MDSERELRAEFRRALDAVVPPAPWLEAAVTEDLGKRGMSRPTHGSMANSRSGARLGSRLAAVLIAVLLVVAAVASFVTIHQLFGPQPAHHVQFRIVGAGAGVCVGLSGPVGRDAASSGPTCGIDTPLFANSNVGWVAESFADQSRGSVLFRTDDAGQHWRVQMTWNGSGPDVIKTSTNGQEALALGLDQQQHTFLFHTTDAGAHWETHALPTNSPSQNVCKAGLCTDQTIGPQVHFLNPVEGWVIYQEPTFGVADIFHTLDSGGSWTLSARVDIKAQFNLDLSAGVPAPNGVIDHALAGQILMTTSTSGWYVTPWTSPAVVYRTHDGGLTWAIQKLQTPTDAKAGEVAIAGMRFFSDREGVVLEVSAISQSPRQYYVSMTTDGGDHWGDPVSLPGGALYLVDVKHWMVWPLNGGWMRTGDGGQHWEQLPQTNLPAYFDIPPPIEFSDLQNGWAVIDAGATGGGFALYGTNNGGASWTPLSLPELS